jgi:hypothetical protein
MKTVKIYIPFQNATTYQNLKNQLFQWRAKWQTDIFTLFVTSSYNVSVNLGKRGKRKILAKL